MGLGSKSGKIAYRMISSYAQAVELRDALEAIAMEKDLGKIIDAYAYRKWEKLCDIAAALKKKELEPESAFQVRCKDCNIPLEKIDSKDITYNDISRPCPKKCTKIPNY